MRSRHVAPVLAALALAAAPCAARAAGPSAYATDSAAPGGVFEFDVASDGFLTPKGSGPAAAGTSTQNLAATPNGAFVYAVAGGSGIFPFAVGPSGQLSAVTGAVTAGTNVVSVAVSPDGHSLYAADSGGGFVYEFDIGSGGQLTQKSSQRIAAGAGTSSVAVSPGGGEVYAVNASSHDVYRYTVGPGGVLQGSPAIVAAGTAPSTIAITPDGHSAFVTDTGAGQVLEYTVGSGGALIARPSVGSGSGPTGIAVSPDGGSAYVANSGDGSVSQYDVQAGGVLAAKGGAAGLVGGAQPQQLALSPSGARLYVPDAATGHDVLYEFAVAGGGAIDTSSARFVGAGSAPGAVIALPDQGPAASFGATAAPAGAPTQFDGRGSTDADGSVTHFDWDFGDGSTALDAGPTPSHAYTQPGAYTVTLSVSDDAGCSTRQVFTGRTAYCNGGTGAVTTRVVNVPPAGPLGTPVFFAGVAAKNQTIRIDKHGLGRISVRCPRGTFGSCIGTLSLVTAGKVRVPRHGKARRAAKRLLLGQAGFNIVSGKAVKIPVQISSAGRKVIAAKKVLKSNAAITAHDRLLTSRKTAFSVRLKPPKRPKKRH